LRDSRRSNAAKVEDIFRVIEEE
jgi:hypothetical protein